MFLLIELFKCISPIFTRFVFQIANKFHESTVKINKHLSINEPINANVIKILMPLKWNNYKLSSMFDDPEWDFVAEKFEILKFPIYKVVLNAIKLES